MSRVGRKPIPIPMDFDVKVDGIHVEVKGPKGILRKSFHPDMMISIEEGQVHVKSPSDSKFHKSLHGLTRTLLANMIQGVKEGFHKTLEIEGVGYRAQKDQKGIVLQLGFSHPIQFTSPEGIELVVETPNRVVVKGMDREKVGEVASKIRSMRKPNPYTSKGVRYEGERIRKKTGKTGAAAGAGVK